MTDPLPRLPVPLRAWMRVRHTARIARDVSAYGQAAGLWWLVPLMGILALVGVALTATTSALPVAVYALF